MKRLIVTKLLAWKNQNIRKPLILQGARQVGKSYIVREFGCTAFLEYQRIDFLADKKVHSVFDTDGSLQPKDLLEKLSVYLNKKINKDKCLLFFDEIQECPNALKSLKFFNEEMPELAIVCAGSYLGIMTNEESYPVGKVEFLDMYPMTFGEFLEAYQESLFEIYQNISTNIDSLAPLENFYHDKLIEVWKIYQAIGGMPEVVNEFIKRKDSIVDAYTVARKIQNQLIVGYQSDFAKHSGVVNASHIVNVFESAGSQLAKVYDENVKKFQFTDVISGRKGFESIRGPLTWLTKSNLLIQNYIVKKSEHPLRANVTDNQFKLYFFDVGILNASLEIPMEALFQSKVGYYQGYIAENFVIQEMIANSHKQSIFSWHENRAEIEFLIIRGAHIVPVEVKSSKNTARTKSLDSYIDRYHPELAIKLSLKNIGHNVQKKILTLPIYLAGRI